MTSHEYEPFPKCPYCHATDEGICDSTEDGEYDCHACGKTFYLEINHVTEYSTFDLED